MAPPPRPPIICYELETNTNARRPPCAKYLPSSIGVARKNKVTLVQRDPSELCEARVTACWHRHESDSDEHDASLEDSENIPLTRAARFQTATKEELRPHTARKAASKSHSFGRFLVEPEPYEFNTNPFGERHQLRTAPKTTTTRKLPPMKTSTTTKLSNIRLDSNNTRHAYGQKLKQEAEERERERVRQLEYKRRALEWQAQLDKTSADLESVKDQYESLQKTFGMSHNVAKYFQQHEEEYARLRRKIAEFSETRSRELSKRLKEMKICHEVQQTKDKRAEEKRSRDMSRLTHRKHTLGSTLTGSLSSNSPTTNTATTNTSSSSTISISSYGSSSLSSSPMSIVDEPMHTSHNVRFVESPPNQLAAEKSLRVAPNLMSSPGSNSSVARCSSISSRRNNSSRYLHKPKDFSFYKPNPSEVDETLEVTDMNFFDKVEDKTMMEVNELFNQMQSVLKDLNQELQ